jgi:hypothetical protein
MISGKGSMGEVALMCIRDFQKYSHNGKMNSYTLPHLLEKVIFRNESVYSNVDGIPSYVWWMFTKDQSWGETIINITEPKVTKTTMRKSVYVDEIPAFNDVISSDGPWKLIFPDMDGYVDQAAQLEHTMLCMGLSYGQNCLSRISCNWSSDSYDDYDPELEINSSIIFAEHIGWIDIPFTVSNIIPKTTGIRVCG